MVETSIPFEVDVQKELDLSATEVKKNISEMQLFNMQHPKCNINPQAEIAKDNLPSSTKSKTA